MYEITNSSKLIDRIIKKTNYSKKNFLFKTLKKYKNWFT